MATQVKHRRGTNAEILAGTPALGELWFNTTDNSIHMGDGVTPGGVKHLSTKTLGGYTDTVFNSIDDMKSGTTISGAIVSLQEGESGTVLGELCAVFKVQSIGSADDIDLFQLNNGLIASRVSSVAGDQFYSYKQRHLLGEQLKRLRNHQATTFTWYGDSNSVRNSDAVPNTFRACLQGAYGVSEIPAINNRAVSGYSAKEMFENITTDHVGNVSIITFGTNDASTQFGYPQEGNIQQYLYWMERLAIRELNWGHPVVFVTPLPTRFDKAFERPSTYGSINYVSPSDPFPTVERADAYLMGEALKYLGAKYSIPVIDSIELMASYKDEMFFGSTQSINLNTPFGDPVHLDTIYSQAWGARIAAQFVGDLVMNAPSVSDGDMFTVTKGLDPFAVKSDRNPHELYSYFAGSTEAAFAQGDNHIGNRCQLLTATERVTYAFYSDADNLMAIPTYMVFDNSEVRVFLDNAEVQPSIKIDNAVSGTSLGVSDYTRTTTTETVVNRPKGFKALGARDESNEYIWMPTKGWHTLTILVNSGSVAVSGLNFLSQSAKELRDLKSDLGVVGDVLFFDVDDLETAERGKMFYALPTSAGLPVASVGGYFIKHEATDGVIGQIQFTEGPGANQGRIWTKQKISSAWGAWIAA